MAAAPVSRCLRDFLPMVFFAVAGRCGVSPRFSRALRGARDGIALTRYEDPIGKFKNEITGARRPESHGASAARRFCLNGSSLIYHWRSLRLSQARARGAALRKTGFVNSTCIQHTQLHI